MKVAVPAFTVAGAILVSRLNVAPFSSERAATMS
jgi:hypothetical protein